MVDPTREEWRRLFVAARAYTSQRPWERMADDELFGVVDPDTGETWWCSVLGALGETLGLAAYGGDAGYAILDLILQNGEPPELEPRPACLLLTLDGKRDLEKRDLAPIRELGLRFRGRQAWPCFRSIRPGFALWHIDGAEARIFATVLEQAANVCARLRAPERLELAGEPERLFVRAPVKGGVGWEDRWVAPPPAPPSPPLEPSVDHDAIDRVARSCRQGKERWECGQFEMRAAVPGPEDRPYFPAAFLILEGESGMILHAGVDAPPFPPETVQRELLETMERCGTIPRHLAVCSARLRAAVEPAAQRLGVKVTMPGLLPAFEAARENLDGYMA